MNAGFPTLDTASLLPAASFQQHPSNIILPSIKMDVLNTPLEDIHAAEALLNLRAEQPAAEPENPMLTWLLHEMISLESEYKCYNFKDSVKREFVTKSMNHVTNKIKDAQIPQETLDEFANLKSKIYNRFEQCIQENKARKEWDLFTSAYTAESKILKQSLPAGTYYVGDLCYVLKDEVYNKVIHYQGFHTNSEHIIGVYHTGDDGAWKDNRGRVYGVDGGNIGIAPIEVCDPKELARFPTITVNNPFDFGWTESKIYLDDPVNSNNSFTIRL